jgi:hypothetical protein
VFGFVIQISFLWSVASNRETGRVWRNLALSGAVILCRGFI